MKSELMAETVRAWMQGLCFSARQEYVFRPLSETCSSCMNRAIETGITSKNRLSTFKNIPITIIGVKFLNGSKKTNRYYINQDQISVKVQVLH